MDKITLINDDAIKYMKSIPSNSIDLIIADPPYNLSKNYMNTNDNMSFTKFIDFNKRWIIEANRILKPGRTIYVFMGMKFISYLYEFMENTLEMKFQSWITWHYTQGLGKKKSFSSRHDDILMFNKKGGKSLFNLDSIRIPQKYYRKVNNMRGANPGNVWEFSHIHYSQKNRGRNPTQKPEGIMERMILASSNENDLILDPFLGSGTTARVAQQTKRRCIGIDIENSFINDSKIRLSKRFNGFDSIDNRMLRIPNDLNDLKIRKLYFINHIKWFLNNHENYIKRYIDEFENKYIKKLSAEEMETIEDLKNKYDE